MKKMLPIAAVALLLASCIGIDADVTVGNDGAVDVGLAYTVSKAVDDIGKLGANADYLPLPVGKSDLELAATRAGGRLKSWARKDGDDRFVVTAALSFPTVQAFASFLDPAGALASVTTAGGRTTLGITLSDGAPPSDPDMADLLEAAFADYAVAIDVNLPKAPAAASGFSVAGRKASFSMKAADLYLSPTPVSLSLTW